MLRRYIRITPALRAASALLAAFMLALCVTGCGSPGNNTPGTSHNSGIGGRSDGGVNSLGLCDVCRVGDTVYFAPAWSLYSVPAKGGEAELIAMDKGCRLLSEHDGKLYFLAQRVADSADSLNTSIMTCSPADGSFETLYEHPLLQNGNYDDMFEIVTYSIRGSLIYFISQENHGEKASSSVYSVPLSGGEALLVAALPENNLPLPYTDIIWSGDTMCFGAFKKDGSSNFIITVVPETGYTAEGFAWHGSDGDRVFADPSDNSIIVCSTENGAMKFTSPDSQVHNRFIDESGIRGFFMNDKYAVYSKSEEYLTSGDTHYTQTAGIYVYDLSSGTTAKIFEPYCELMGLAGDRVFYFDESALSAYTDVSQLGGYTFRATLCSVNADGTGTAVLCSVDDDDG